MLLLSFMPRSQVESWLSYKNKNGQSVTSAWQKHWSLSLQPPSQLTLWKINHQRKKTAKMTQSYGAVVFTTAAVSHIPPSSESITKHLLLFDTLHSCLLDKTSLKGRNLVISNWTHFPNWCLNYLKVWQVMDLLQTAALKQAVMLQSNAGRQRYAL